MDKLTSNGVCTHGGLKVKCQICELQDENAILKKRVEVLESELRDAQHIVTNLRGWVKVLETENTSLTKLARECANAKERVEKAEADLLHLIEAVENHRKFDPLSYRVEDKILYAGSTPSRGCDGVMPVAHLSAPDIQPVQEHLLVSPLVPLLDCHNYLKDRIWVPFGDVQRE